jgi:NADH dehydrogenase
MVDDAALAHPQGPHRLVIIGGGAGGLELAARLGHGVGRRGQAEVLLVDPFLTHVWKPLLHEMAAGTLRAHEGVVDFLPQARRHHFRFHLGTMESLDRRRRQVRLSPLLDGDGMEIAPRRMVGYDTLVLSVGSVVNDFGIPGVSEHALRLDSAEDASRLQRRLMATCLRAELQGQGPVRVVIVGGGATGVELAAELADAVREIAGYGPRLSRLKRPAHVCIVETGARLLAALPEATAALAQADLQQRGVEVRLRARVGEVSGGHVRLDTGEALPADLTVWCAGIRGPGLLEHLDGLALTPARQLRVRPTLRTEGDEHIFALGDCAHCPMADAKAVPPRAQAAHQQARFLARALPLHLAGRPLPAFRFRDYGALVSIGRSSAVGSLVGQITGRRFNLHGALARWSYRVQQRRHLALLHGPVRALLATLGAWLTGRSQPAVKLH